MKGPFEVQQKTVVVLKIGDSGGVAVCAIATTEAIADDIVEGLNKHYLEKLMSGEGPAGGPFEDFDPPECE